MFYNIAMLEQSRLSAFFQTYPACHIHMYLFKKKDKERIFWLSYTQMLGKNILEDKIAKQIKR